MSIKFKSDPLGAFCQRGRKFLEAPGAISGMEFDDAVVNLKRYLLSQLHNRELAVTVGKLGPLIRNQEVDALCTLFEDILESLEQYREK